MRAVTGWDRIDEQDDKGNDMGWLDESYLPFILDSGCFCYPKVWKMLDNNLQELLLNEEKLAKLTPLQLAMVLNAIARWLVFFKSYLDDGAGPPNSEGGGVAGIDILHQTCELLSKSPLHWGREGLFTSFDAANGQWSTVWIIWIHLEDCIHDLRDKVRATKILFLVV